MSQEVCALPRYLVYMLSGAVLTLLAASAAKKAAGGGGCEVTSTWPDGRVEQRQCVVQAVSDRPGARGRFESCTA